VAERRTTGDASQASKLVPEIDKIMPVIYAKDETII
jgi:hypothetical protein